MLIRNLAWAPLVFLLLVPACADDDPAQPDGGGTPEGGSGPGGAGGNGGSGGTPNACPLPPDDLPALTFTPKGELLEVVDFPLEGFLPRDVNVYLPVGYDEATRYPVIYFTDGQWVFGPSGYLAQDAMEELVTLGLIEPHIIVAIDNTTERTRELTPDEDPDDIRMNGDGDAFAGQIVERVKPFIDASFSTRCGREDTTIAGFSLGGLMCLHMLMRDPDVFGRGVCISPSFWWADEAILGRFDDHTGELPEKLWIDVGTLEAPTPQLVQQFPDFDLWVHPRAIRKGRDAAIDKGMTLGNDLGYYEAFEAEHTPMDVGDRMASALAFTLSDVSLARRTPVSHAFNVWHEQIFAPPAHISLQESIASFELRYDAPFVLTLPGDMVELSSQDESVVDVDVDGILHAIATGTATIDATAVGLDASDTIEVLPAP